MLKSLMINRSTPVFCLLLTWVWMANIAKADRDVAHLPVSQWQVELEEPAENTIKLAEVDGCLSIVYDLNINSQHQVGHQAFNQKSFFLIRQTPIELSQDDGRIVYEAYKQDGKSLKKRQRESNILLMPVIEDANGERLIYAPTHFPHLKNDIVGWAKWMTPNFYTSEAGGATQDIYEAQNGDKNAWPDGKLKFIGFRVDVRNNEYGRKKGEIFVGSINVSGQQLQLGDPYFYADTVFKDAGTYQVAATVCNVFQGTPIREQVNTLTFDPANQLSRRQKVSFELGPNDNYWINYQIQDAQGNVVERDTMRYQILNRPDAPRPTNVALTQAPPAGFLRINPDAHTQGVFERDEPLTVKVRVFPGAKKSLVLQWKLLQYQYPGVLDQGQVSVPDSQKAFMDLSVKSNWQDNRDAYQLELSLMDGKTNIDSRIYLLGRKSNTDQVYQSRKGKILDRDYVKKSPYFRTTFVIPNTSRPKSEEEALTYFQSVCDESFQMARYMTYMVDLRDFEVLPGVFDFCLLDKIMDAASDRGMALTIRYAHADSHGEYRWLKYYRQQTSDNLEIYGHYYGTFALTDPNMQDFWKRAYRATYNRYQNHPGFQGFYIMEPSGESTVMDKPWEGQVAGYNPTVQSAFCTYLRDVMKLDLNQVNKRWGSSYKQWGDIELPKPRMQMGTLPDLRMHWVDFNCFKSWLDEDGWYPQAARAIRAYAPKHVLITYGSPDSQELVGLVDYGHNGGNHYMEREGQLIEAWDKHQTGWITEPHHPHRWAAYGDPAERGWVLDWSTYIMSAQAGAGGANLHVYFLTKPFSLVSKYAGAYSFDRFEKFKPILNELHHVRMIRNQPQVLAIQDPYTLYCKHRTTFSPRLDDLRRYFELLKYGGVKFDLKPMQSLDQYKLVLPNPLDEVISEKTLMQIDTMVRQHGAKAIISAITGKYCPERGQEPYALLKQLGITPPTGEYIRNEAHVIARVEQTNPLFETGSELKFFSQADQQLALDSDQVKVREKFWTWAFRWIPQTDYFGYYRDNMQTNGKVLARFASGAVAVSEHQVGKGQIIVFWGMPNYTPENYQHMMPRAAQWAGINDPTAGNPVPLMIEARNDELKRHYVLMYQETAGSYQQTFPNVPDGEYFLDDMINDERLGVYTGKELREKGPMLTWRSSMSPLKIIRAIPYTEVRAPWVDRYGGDVK